MALSFSGRLIRMIETSPFCSTVTTLIDAIPFFPTRTTHDRRQQPHRLSPPRPPGAVGESVA